MRLINPVEGLRLASKMTPAYHATMLTISFVIYFPFEPYFLAVDDKIVLAYSAAEMAMFFRLSYISHIVMILLACLQKFFI